MYFGTFESELSVEEVCRAIENRIEKGRIANWDKSCIIGRVKNSEFKLRYHIAFLRNSFEKIAYGWVLEKMIRQKLYIFL